MAISITCTFYTIQVTAQPLTKTDVKYYAINALSCGIVYGTVSAVKHWGDNPKGAFLKAFKYGALGGTITCYAKSTTCDIGTGKNLWQNYKTIAIDRIGMSVIRYGLTNEKSFSMPVLFAEVCYDDHLHIKIRPYSAITFAVLCTQYKIDPHSTVKFGRAVFTQDVAGVSSTYADNVVIKTPGRREYRSVYYVYGHESVHMVQYDQLSLTAAYNQHVKWISYDIPVDVAAYWAMLSQTHNNRFMEKEAEYFAAPYKR